MSILSLDQLASLSIAAFSLWSLRYLNSNQLSGTIPAQFGNLMNLTNLYAQNRTAFHVLNVAWIFSCLYIIAKYSTTIDHSSLSLFQGPL